MPYRDHGESLLVSLFTFKHNDLSSNPTEAFSFFGLKVTKNRQKEVVVGPFIRTNY